MKDGPHWDRWQDAFWAAHQRAPYFDEVVRAIQADALGLPEPPPLTEGEIDALADRYLKPA